MLSSKIWGGKEEVEERGRGGEGKRMRKQGEEMEEGEGGKREYRG